MISYGKLIYSPKSHLGISDNWAILACDDEISSYYRTLYYREFPWKGKLIRPIWGTHISISRGEKIHSNWKLDNLKLIEFEYEPGVLDNAKYFWLKVNSPYLESLRKSLGLSKTPKYGFHLTIGVHAQ